MPTQSTPTELVSSDADVRAVLADPAYVVPIASHADEIGTLAWLRAHVARFCEGDEHDRRRALATREIASLDPAGLRGAAARLAAAELNGYQGHQGHQGHQKHQGSGPFDVMPLARRVPAAALAAGLGLAQDDIPVVVDAMLAAVSGYLNPDLAGPDADAAVASLVATFGPAEPEPLANRIGLLMQACDATAALIGNALIAAFADDATVEEMISRTIACDPPTLRTRRVSPDGELVTIDISGCPFGAGRRPCPAVDQAKALAAGVVEAILAACELADQQIGYVPSPNLRMPASLLVTLSQ